MGQIMKELMGNAWSHVNTINLEIIKNSVYNVMKIVIAARVYKKLIV